MRGESVSEADVAALEEAAVQRAVARVAPSVVRIVIVGQGGDGAIGSVTGATTGLVVSNAGHIVTSVDRLGERPETVLVEMPQGERMVGRLLAVDHSRLIVLIQVEKPGEWIVPEAVGDEESSVGGWAIAVGRALDQRQVTLSAGILSARNRLFGKAIQTDAKVSSINYGGPLIDIHGRVLGVLVPFSPLDENRPDAGSQWYDSGIGFAVPMSEITRVLPRLSKGEDLHAGLLGVSLKPGHLYDEPAEIAAVPPTSPAREAGLLPGDRVIEVDSRPVACAADLRQEVGRRYAGDTVSLAVLRGTERIEAQVTLVERLLPFQHAYLGVLPRRDAPDAGAPGVSLRHIFADGPADKAGLRAGDRIVEIAGREVKDLADVLAAMNTLAPAKPAEVSWIRDGARQRQTVTPGRLTAEIPAELPAARIKTAVDVDSRAEARMEELPLADWTNRCDVYLPETYDGGAAHGLVVWLGSSSTEAAQGVLEIWKPYCRRHELVFAAPQPADPKSWSAHELAYVREVIARIMGSYTIDPGRVVVHGRDTGGTMACLVGFSDRQHVRGIIALESPFPAGVRYPENDPVLRVSVLTAFAPDLPRSKALRESVLPLAQAGYPIEIMNVGSDAKYLSEAELEKLGRWIDALDRF